VGKDLRPRMIGLVQSQTNKKKVIGDEDIF